MIEKKDIGEALPAYVEASTKVVAAWKALEPLLPEATGREAEAVAAVKDAVKLQGKALGELVMAMILMGRDTDKKESQ